MDFKLQDFLPYVGLAAFLWNCYLFYANRCKEKDRSLSKFYQDTLYKHVIEDNICLPCTRSNLILLNIADGNLMKEKLLEMQATLTTVQTYLSIFYSINPQMASSMMSYIDDHIDNIFGIYQDIEVNDENQNYDQVGLAALLFITKFYALITNILESINSVTINSLSK